MGKSIASDVIEAAKKLKCPILRCIGGNTISGYRWMDGVGPKEERPSRHDLAWNLVDYKQIGTNEYIKFCRKINAEPYFVVNCKAFNVDEAIKYKKIVEDWLKKQDVDYINLDFLNKEALLYNKFDADLESFLRG